MVDLVPNGLVTELCEGLKDSGPDDFRQAVAAASTEQDYALAIAEYPDVPDMVAFVGYLGATIDRDGSDWCVFYLDLELRTWLLVERDGIVRRKRITDTSSTNEERDVIWVKADAVVGRGSGSLTLERQFLTGEFTQAADFDDTPPSGGTLAAETGVFCEARSVGCCTPKSRPRR